jgi:hypothetical protein
MTQTATDSQIFVATESGCAEIDGTDHPFKKGVTHVRAGHPLLSACPDYFEPAEDRVAYDVEDTTAEPGKRRGSRSRAS